jgi:hypothetical protein
MIELMETLNEIAVNLSSKRRRRRLNKDEHSCTKMSKTLL